MYELFFDFQARPFVAAPQADSYYGAEATEVARQKLSRCIDRAEGPGMLVGPPGTGKTLLLNVLASEFSDRFHIAMPATGQLATRRALLQSILYELHLPYRGLDEGELRLALMDHLRTHSKGKEGMLLLVDEAHTLPIRLLEEIRLITNFVHQQQPTVRLVLAGTLELEERFAHPKMHLFNQRITARCYTHAFTREETGVYIQSQITAVGRSAGDVFTTEAVDAVHEVSSGIPRLINQVCDYVLTLSSLGGQESISRQGVEEAWADLQQLPAPATLEAAPVSSEDDFVEFGGLDDDMTSSVPFAAHDDEMPETLNQATVIADASQQLDDIQSQVTAMEAESLTQPLVHDAAEEAEDDQFQPAGSIGPEIELTFTGVHDPFTEQFADEEVVVDHYSALEMSHVASKLRVSSEEGRGIAAILESPAPATAQKPISASSSASRVNDALDVVEPPEDEIVGPEESPATISRTSQWAENPNIDRVMPDNDVDEELDSNATQPAIVAVHQSDDRSAIIIDEQAITGESPDRTGRARRQEYRQLFSKLRRG